MFLRSVLDKRYKLMMLQQVHHKAPGDDRLTQGDRNILRLTVDFLQQFWQANSTTTDMVVLESAPGAPVTRNSRQHYLATN